MIETRKVMRYRALCDNCNWSGDWLYNEQYATQALSRHKCGEHRRVHDSTGGYRGILGGWNVRCVCGAAWVVQNSSEKFKCPMDFTAPV